MSSHPPTRAYVERRSKEGLSKREPATRELAGHGLQVLGVDFSGVQLRRAHQLVPAARFVQADMTAFSLRPASVDAVVSFYALIHVPLADQQALFPRVRKWMRPAATCWLLPERADGPGLSATSARTCSGITRTPAPTCAGYKQLSSRPSGAATSPEATAGTASSWPRQAKKPTQDSLLMCGRWRESVLRMSSLGAKDMAGGHAELLANAVSCAGVRASSVPRRPRGWDRITSRAWHAAVSAT
jgi:Methyltransferase domain